MNQRNWPWWWTWDLELSPHLFKRMEDRDFNEVDLRTMLTRARSYRPASVEGRWIIETRYRGRPWEVVLEPDPDFEVVTVVTAYSVWSKS